MAVLFALLAAAGYGTSDFAAGLASRRIGFAPVTVAVQFSGLFAALIGVLLFPGAGPTWPVILWGAFSGAGGAGGTLMLYRGLAVGRMSVVATLSAVVSAVVPVIVGLTLGDHLAVLTAVGIAIAIPAIGLVSWHEEPGESHRGRPGVVEGVLAGLGITVLYIGLQQAGTASGAWPLVPSLVVSSTLPLPFALRAGISGKALRPVLPLVIGAGVLAGTANLCFLASTGHGQLAVVAVLAGLYPVVTVLLARAFLSEHWSRLQAAGLVAAAAAIVLVGLG